MNAQVGRTNREAGGRIERNKGNLRQRGELGT